jgi:hypothetical protein
MAGITEQVRTLDTRVDTLETWAGPGQVEALIQGQRDLRRQLSQVQRVQERHTRMISGLMLDVAGLRADVAEASDSLRELLRRLPAGPAPQ